MIKLLHFDKIKKFLPETNFNSENVTIFSIFGIINYPIFYILWGYLYEQEYDNLYPRLIAGSLCLLLLLRKFWPKRTKILIKPLWYITICYSLPFFCSYYTLVNHFALNWILNSIFATFLLVILLNWLEFFIITAVGVLTGYLVYFIQFGNSNINTHDLSNLFIGMTWIILVCLVFSYNKSYKDKEQKKLVELLFNINMVLDQKVTERTESLEKALNLQSEFINNISHEIRTPIHAISGISQGLIEQWEQLNDDNRYKYANLVAKNALRLHSLIKVILDLSLLKNGKLELEIGKIDLIAAILDIKEECEELYLENNNNLTIKFNDNDIPKAIIQGDYIRIIQVFRNLIVNSIKFAKTGDIQIEIQKNIKKNCYLISIQDSGPGIPDGEYEQVFKPFYQSTYTKTNAGGTGLGLSISEAIIKAHNGKIWFNNLKPNGTKFFIELNIYS